MKKSILLLSMAMCLSTMCLAQGTASPTKSPDPVKPAPLAKETYQVDMTKPYTVTVTFTLPVLSVDNYILIEQHGGVDALKYANQISALEATNRTTMHKAFTDSLTAQIARRYAVYLKSDQERFTADTLAKYHPSTNTKKH